MKRSRSDEADVTASPSKIVRTASECICSNVGTGLADGTSTASDFDTQSHPQQCTGSLLSSNPFQQIRRGFAYAYLHYIYEPCCYRRRVKEVRAFLANRRNDSSSQLPVEEVVQTAERSPFRASLPTDAHCFLEPSGIHQRPGPTEVFQALPTRRAALRASLELRRIGISDSMFSRPDPAKRHLFSRIPLQVKRDTVFDSVVEALLAAMPSQLLAGVHVRFVGPDNVVEVGVDSGGLSREFFNLVLNDLVVPEDTEVSLSSQSSSSGLSRMSSVEGFKEPVFREQADNALMLIPSFRPMAVYHALGRLVAVALVHASYGDVALPHPFNDCLLKYIVGQPISATDVRRRDPLYYKNRIDALLRPGGIEETAAALCVQELVFEEDGVELKPGGAMVAVTPENVEEYIALLSEEYVCGKVRKELAQFLAGFYYVVPQEVLQDSGISFGDLGVLLSGVPELDVASWRGHAVVRAAGVEPTIANQVVDWLWAILEAWPQEDRSAVLAFATGCSRLPAVGFSRLDPPFTVEVVPNPPGHLLPTAHTCFNCLSLPAYSSEELLTSKLAIAAREGNVGFSMR